MALGVLSLLILIVTAFAIAMRVEHLAARNGRDKARSGHYLHAGLALATETVSAMLIERVTTTGGGWYVGPPPPPEDGDTDMDTLLARLGSEWAERVPLLDTTNGPCMASSGYRAPGYPSLLSGVATNLLSPGLRERALRLPTGWTYIVTTNAISGSDRVLAGRVAFLAVDLTGTMDANFLTTNQFLAAAQLSDAGSFFTDRAAHRRYETTSELPGNRGLYDAAGAPAVDDAAFDDFLDALGTYSYDPNPEQLAWGSIPGDMGSIVLTNKFDVNSITNSFAGRLPDPARSGNPVRFYTDFNDLNGYFAAISNAVFQAEPQFPATNRAAATAVYWNLINYLDADRVPQTDTDHPWLDDYGVEAVPLINEIVVAQTNLTSSLTNHYVTSVELWYPFAPNDSTDDIDLQVALYPVMHDWDSFQPQLNAMGDPVIETQQVVSSNLVNNVYQFTTNSVTVTNNFQSAIVSSLPSSPEGATSAGFTNDVPVLHYPDEAFYVARAPEPFCFPVGVQMYDALGAPTVVVTNYLPIGIAEYVSYIVTSNSLPGGGYSLLVLPVTNRVVNTVSFAVRVSSEGNPVDEAPGPRLGVEPTAIPWFLTIADAFSASVIDPRWNGRAEYWTDAVPTLGAMNTELVEDTDSFQGLPILHRDGLLATVGEVGYLGTATRWQSLNLFEAHAAKLLDLWTTHQTATNTPTYAQGRIHALTEYPASIRALFADTRFGTNRFAAAGAADFAVTDNAFAATLDSLTNALLSVRGNIDLLPMAATNDLLMTLPFATWLPLLGTAMVDSGETSSALATYAPLSPGYDVPGADQLEDLIRDLPDRVTFRQNLVLLLLRAQTLARNGRITADSAVAALLIRDAYTGAWRLRHVLPLH